MADDNTKKPDPETEQWNRTRDAANARAQALHRQAYDQMCAGQDAWHARRADQGSGWLTQTYEQRYQNEATRTVDTNIKR